MKRNIAQQALLSILAFLICTTAVRAGQLSASIRRLIEATQQVEKAAEQSCSSGDPKGCDEALVARARLSILQLELRHPSGKIEDAIEDVDIAMSDLEGVLDDE